MEGKPDLSACRILLPALALGLAGAAPAQTGDVVLQELSSPPFAFLYPESFQADARNLEARGRQVLPEMIADLGAVPPSRIEVYLVAVQDPRGGRHVPDWAAAYVPHGSATIVIFRGRLGSYPSLEIEGVFLHELTHVLIQSTLGDRSDRIPRWFGEGVSMLQSRRWGFRDTFAISTTFLRGSELPLETIAVRFPEGHGAAQSAYAESFAFLSYLVARHGDDLPRRLLAAVRAGGDFPAAFREATGTSLGAAERGWRESMIWKYRWIPIMTSNGLLFSAVGLLFLVSYWRKRAQARRKLEMWDRYEPRDFS
jgi:hypothetical protein